MWLEYRAIAVTGEPADATPPETWNHVPQPLLAFHQVSDGGETLFVVTQSPARQACLATAVDAATGQVRWQRQLGLSCQGDPVSLSRQPACDGDADAPAGTGNQRDGHGVPRQNVVAGSG